MQNFGQFGVRCFDRLANPPNRQAGSLPHDSEDVVVYAI